MSARTCPYVNCQHQLTNIESHALDFCDRCRGPVILCPDCHCTNGLWAVHCRACGRAFSNKQEMINRYEPRFLREWRESYGLFLQKMIEPNPVKNWEGKLVGINGSLLIFTNRTNVGYGRLCLIHPHLQAEPVELHQLIGNPDGETSFSGAAAVTDKYLFLGSNRYLYQIDIPSISTAQPYRVDKHAHVQTIGCDEVMFLDQDMLLLGERMSQHKIRFYIWDIEKKKGADQIEENADYFALYGDRLFLACPGNLSFFQIDTENRRFVSRGTLDISPWRPESKPCFVERRLYIIATRSEDGEKALLKWKTDGEAPHDSVPDTTILERDDRFVLRKIEREDYYMLISNNSADIYAPFYNTKQHSFSLGNGIYTSVGPGIFGSLIAIPFVNQPDSYSVSVVDGRSGQYIFITEEPFFNIFSDPLLWGRYLFVLGQKHRESAIGLYGYDLKGEATQGN